MADAAGTSVGTDVAKEALPNDERFDRREAAAPLLRAVEELAGRLGRPVDEMEQLTLGEIAALAAATYGPDLPEFWRVWNDWNRPDQEQPMGDL
jgi:hypothetical protein